MKTKKPVVKEYLITEMNIKQIRKELGLTQRQLADELGLAKNGDVYIRKVENGKTEASGLLLKAAKMLYKLKKYETR